MNEPLPDDTMQERMQGIRGDIDQGLEEWWFTQWQNALNATAVRIPDRKKTRSVWTNGRPSGRSGCCRGTGRRDYDDHRLA